MKITLINFPPSSGSSRLLIEFAAFDFIYCVCVISMMCYLLFCNEHKLRYMRVWEIEWVCLSSCQCQCVCVYMWPGKRAIVCNLHDCPLSIVKINREKKTESERERESNRFMCRWRWFSYAVAGKIYAHDKLWHLVCWVSVAPYAHNFRILNHT